MLTESIKTTVRIVRFGLPILWMDARSKFRHGWNGPVKYQWLHMPPAWISQIMSLAAFEKEIGRPPGEPQTPVILGGCWDQVTAPLESRPRIRQVMARILDGGDWIASPEYLLAIDEIKKTGAYRNRIHSEQELLEHYQTIDRLIESVRDEARLRSSCEFSRIPFRAFGGIGVAIARNGVVLKSSHGNHRIAVARALKLPAVPVAIHVVHREAIINGVWARLLHMSCELCKVHSRRIR